MNLDAVSRDTGCNLAPSCLRCPFPKCKHDEPHGGRQAIRDRDIVILRKRYGVAIDIIASWYKIDVRTVSRVAGGELNMG